MLSSDASNQTTTMCDEDKATAQRINDDKNALKKRFSGRSWIRSQ